MTIFYSGMVNQMMAQQTAMFAGQNQYAQSFGPRPVAPPTSMFDVSARQTGMFGEQVAGQAAGFMRGMAGVGMAGASIAGAFAGIPTDPLSAAFAGGSMGMRFGLGGAALGAGAAALPMYAATAYVGALGQAFTGGMQDQVSLNSTLRNNFQFYGGGGPMNRGFSQSQMGQIGNTVAGQLRSNPFTNASELNQLISGGAEMGLFSNTTNVHTFSQNFRRMISSLRDIQRELGGSLTEAQDFIRQSQQSGVFNRVDQTRLAGNLRTAEATTGMNRQQLMQLSDMGANVARAAGGRGHQGAFGALNMATQLGAAVQGGYLSQELLSDATGGLQGSEAVQALTMRMMQATDRFSRTGAGRYMTFAMSNANGTGLDSSMMERLRSGDISVSEIRSRAQRNVNSMGRARALNQEGYLRGAQMEQGGMAANLSYLRLAMGDQIEDPGSERGQYFMRRRMGFSQSEAEAVASLMRNQGSIAMNESVTRNISSRESSYNREVAENRSFDGFMRHLEHGMSENLGIREASEMGRRFATRISSAVERGFNALMGLSEGQLSREQQMSLARVSLGRGTRNDVAEMQMAFSAASRFSGQGGSAWNPNSVSMYDRVLGGLGMHTQGSVSEQMRSRGDTRFDQYSPSTQIDRVMRADMARSGYVTGRDREALTAMMGDRAGTVGDIFQAQLRARGAGHEDNWYQYLTGARNGQANAVDAYLSSIGAGASQGRAPSTEQGFMGSGGVSAGLRAMFGANAQTDALGFIARGGHSAARRQADLEAMRARNRSGGRRAGGGGALMGDDSFRAAPGAVDEERRLQAAIRGLNVSQEDLTGLMSGGAFRSLYGQALSAEGNDTAFGSAITSLQEESLRLSGGQRGAAQTLITQMQESRQRNGGRLGREFHSIAFDPSQAAEAARQLAITGGAYRTIGAQLGDAEGLGALGQMYTNVGNLYAQGGPDAANRIQSAGMERARYLNGMSDDARQRAYDILGTTEQGRADMQSAMQYRRVDQNLAGRGRRGAQGARESAAELVSGGTVGDMEFSVGGRTVRGQRGLYAAMGIGRRGTPEEQARARQDYIRQMQEQNTGISSDSAGAQFDALLETARGSTTENGRRVQFSEEERARLQTVASETGASEAQSRRTMDQARAANPLMAQVSRTLEEIRDRLPTTTERQTVVQIAEAQRNLLVQIAGSGAPDAVPTGTADGAGN